MAYKVPYAIKIDNLGSIGSKEGCMPKIKELNQEIRKFFKPFLDRRTNVVAYRGAICNQKGGMHYGKFVCKKARS